MNKVQFGKLLGMIESLSSSTAVVYEHNGLVAGLDGRCSSYLSHQSVNFAASESTMPEGIRGMLRIAGNREILVGARPLGEAELEDLKFWWPGHHVVQEQVPVHLLTKILEEAEKLVDFGALKPKVGNGDRRDRRGVGAILATVVFPIATVASWGKDGKPSFVDPDAAMANLLGLPAYDLDREVKSLDHIPDFVSDAPSTGRELIRELSAIRHQRVAKYLDDIRWAFGMGPMPAPPWKQEPEAPVEDMSQFAHYVDPRLNEDLPTE